MRYSSGPKGSSANSCDFFESPCFPVAVEEQIGWIGRSHCTLRRRARPRDRRRCLLFRDSGVPSTLIDQKLESPTQRQRERRSWSQRRRERRRERRLQPSSPPPASRLVHVPHNPPAFESLELSK